MILTAALFLGNFAKDLYKKIIKLYPNKMFLLLNRFLIVVVALCLVMVNAVAQPKLDFELRKPKKFENRKLGSEKTDETKFTIPRRFIQNTVTHYNYYFNAAEKLDQMLSRAKDMHVDDYSKLLPFYNYRLDRTASFKQDIDSVIYKCTAGILLHDLRNSFIDNLYLLLGEAYYFRNQLDSAYLTFQYLNYSFSPKEKDGYDKVIGSNANSQEGGNAFSVSTKEKTGIVSRAWAMPPSRNDGFIWQIRTYIANGEYAEAGGLITTLKNDPLFPERLKTDLNEVQAWNFYRMEMYDSCAFYLSKALDNAENHQERSRWEFLLGQLYVMNDQQILAEQYFNKSIQHTINPVQEVYARLYCAKLTDGSVQNPLDVALAELLKMAKREKYLLYRDVVYYTAAEVEQMRNNPAGAKALLIKSVESSIDNPLQKTKSFLALGDVCFSQKQYVDASRYYDSVDVKSLDPELDIEKQLNDRKEGLRLVAKEINIINRQDSLQLLAAMPEKEREELLKKMVRTLRRQQGLKDEEFSTGSANVSAGRDNSFSDLFSATAKGDWYFYNSSQKLKGANEFKASWGSRPNVDNWRRSSAIVGAVAQVNNQGREIENGNKAVSANARSGEISYENLLAGIPTTPEKMKISNDSIEHATFNLGVALQNYIEDYYSAIDSYDSLLINFPQTSHEEEALFNLYYCYKKVGMADKQLAAKRMLTTRYGNGSLASRLINKGPSPDSLLKMNATVLYDDIYNKFIEGDFDRAIAEKKIADSLYGKKYWTPQLLYIEGVHYIHEREDSTAKLVLNSILQLYPNSPMREKTQNLLSVLSRRKEIEEYLTNLKIERPVDDTSTLIADAEPKKVEEPQDVELKDVTAKANDNLKLREFDLKNGKTTIKPQQDALHSIDPSLLYLYEKDLSKKQITSGGKDSLIAKSGQPGVTMPDQVSASRVLDSSLLYQYEKDLDVKVIGKPGGDSGLAQNKPIIANPELQAGQKIDTSKLSDIIVKEVASTYTIEPLKSQYVALVMEKVDPVYVNEAKTAFGRYNRDYYSGKSIELTNLSLTDNEKLLLVKGFANMNEALDYLQKARSAAPIEIIPWLNASKYYFVLLSETNLELLKNKKNIREYRSFLQESLPSHFKAQ